MPWEKVAFSREVHWAINACHRPRSDELQGGICPLIMKLMFILLEILQPKPSGLGMLGWGWEGWQAEPQQQALQIALV